MARMTGQILIFLGPKTNLRAAKGESSISMYQKKLLHPNLFFVWGITIHLGMESLLSRFLNVCVFKTSILPTQLETKEEVTGMGNSNF